jgi:phage protein U
MYFAAEHLNHYRSPYRQEGRPRTLGYYIPKERSGEQSSDLVNYISKLRKQTIASIY